MFHTIKSLLYWLTLFSLITITTITTLSVSDIPGLNFDFLIIQSGSMEPTIKTGSVIVVAPQTSYQPNDIITFKNGATANIKKPGQTTTHRIIDTGLYQNLPSFTTQGDANSSPDREQVPLSWVLGKVILTLPYLGYVVHFVRTPTGTALLIIVPAAIVIYQELINIKKELTHLITKHKSAPAKHPSP